MQGPAVGPALGNLVVGPPAMICGERGKARGDQLLFNLASQQLRRRRISFFIHVK